LARRGRDDTNDGESTDPQRKPKTYYWFGKGETGDDIGNWPWKKTPDAFRKEWQKGQEQLRAEEKKK
jgi:hypothetical protein